ncbi:MAG: hypothetical protein ROD09_03090 [Candidatus Sedimenticola sp. (ex Thyasira tokunagai)]
MDVASVVFSAFIQALVSPFQAEVSGIIGTEIEAKVVEYRGTAIDFQYQLWQIKPPSVCADKRNNIQDFSDCTIAAKELFRETCSYLANNKKSHWQYKKLKNMYCRAASSYSPTYASISRSSQKDMIISDAKQKCSLLTLQAGETGNVKDEVARKDACQKYKQMKGAF